MDIEKLKSVILTENFKITFHALQEKEFDNLSIDEIIHSINNAELIEDYPTSKPFPCCLLLSFNNKNQPIHSVWAYTSEAKMAILITVYRPSPEKWVEYKKRK